MTIRMTIHTNRFSAPARGRARIVGALAGIMLLSGCSSFEFVYSFADDWLEARAERYLDLSSEQEAELERQSAALIAWHRKAMLPKYAAYFQAQADIAETGGWTRPQLSGAFTEFRALLDETVEGASPFIAAVLVDHTTPEKVAYLKGRMAERMAERRADEEAETPEESLDEWIERRVDRFSRFTGALSDEQVAIIRRYAERRTDDSGRWLNNREMRQGALVAFLREEPSPDEIARFVHRILLHAHEIVDPEYRAISEARWRLFEDMYFDVLSSLSEVQRRGLVLTLRGYASDMVDLAGV